MKQPKKRLNVTQFSTGGTLNTMLKPAALQTERQFSIEPSVDPETEHQARLSARMHQFKQYERRCLQTRPTATIGNNSYIKPRSLLSISLDYNTFERF